MFSKMVRKIGALGEGLAAPLELASENQGVLAGFGVELAGGAVPVVRDAFVGLLRYIRVYGGLRMAKIFFICYHGCRIKALIVLKKILRRRTWDSGIGGRHHSS